MQEILSLYELNSLVRTTIETAFPDTFTVTAEIASCDVKNHCYLTLVDKQNDTIRAEIRAAIWAGRYRVIAPVFEEATGTKLAKGIKILFQATVTFHERYGLKLTIHNIDPSYTVGELAVKRKETLERLAREELIDKNRQLFFPLVPQRIGIVSSSTAAGYEDLMNHLMHNVYGYSFKTRLYEAVMQGDKAEASVVQALKQCASDSALLDVVVIVRGGGGQVDLHCFDSYEIGRAIALLPLPVIAGIGHQRDVTVVDAVSAKIAKTPTAAADMIISAVKEFEDRVDALAHSMAHGVRTMTVGRTQDLSSLSQRLESGSRNILLEGVYRLEALLKGLHYSLKLLKNEKQALKARESSVKYLDPANVLKRGYSITLHNKAVLKTIEGITEGDSLRTILHEGEFTSRLEKKKKTRRPL